jgi:hypothetical protein
MIEPNKPFPDFFPIQPLGVKLLHHPSQATSTSLGQIPIHYCVSKEAKTSFLKHCLTPSFRE